ncbi:hypothetical protein CSKR_100449 [Clonorchis sinensis]|uniref:Uncharacterized protein n=1 Tax=Clonorchis sinensis TaxID=79923 RepID=A0A3R7F2S8_CLOSI|nr:hypothetical protein CSKR_100449 [Clonorchis sinensis]
MEFHSQSTLMSRLQPTCPVRQTNQRSNIISRRVLFAIQPCYQCDGTSPVMAENIRKPCSIAALVSPLGSVEARHRKGVTSERLLGLAPRHPSQFENASGNLIHSFNESI